MSGWRDRMHNFWLDQGFVRVFWDNGTEIAPGVFRSNQPARRRLQRLQRQGLRSVLFLRGTASGAPFRAEEQACASLGLAFHIFHMSAHRLPEADKILTLVALFRRIEKPFLLHCRAGADRTGLASAIYLLAVAGRPVAEARGMLSLRFGHWNWSSTGILDQLLRHFELDQRESGIEFEDWIRTVYDPDAMTSAFKKQRLLHRIRFLRD